MLRMRELHGGRITITPTGDRSPLVLADELTYAKTLAAIRRLPAGGDNAAAVKCIKALAEQIQALITENRGGSCGDRTKYRARLRAKLGKRWEEYEKVTSAQ